jgi:hypothetical protein
VLDEIGEDEHADAAAAAGLLLMQRNNARAAHQLIRCRSRLWPALRFTRVRAYSSTSWNSDPQAPLSS